MNGDEFYMRNPERRNNKLTPSNRNKLKRRRLRSGGVGRIQSKPLPKARYSVICGKSPRLKKKDQDIADIPDRDEPYPNPPRRPNKRGRNEAN